MRYNARKLQGILKILKESGKKIAFCHGCFDGLHDGHIKLFQKAKRLADIVVVGIERDEYIKGAKGEHRPFYPLSDRIEAIIKTGLIDYVFVIPKGNPKKYKKLFLDIRPDYLVTAIDEMLQKKKEDAITAGIKLILIKEKDHHSRDKIMNSRSL